MLSNIRDRFLRLRLQKDEKEIKFGFTVSALVIFSLIANVIYLNLYVLKLNESKQPETISVVATPTPTPATISTPSPVPIAPQNQNTAATSAPISQSKDYYINLGYGTNQSTDWTDVSGTLETFDIAQYKNIKEVRLETTLTVPTENGTVSVRLFNKTDGYAVWNSDRTVQAQASIPLLVSQNITYPFGPKLYSIQMMSQLGVLVNLLQGRVHIVAE